MTIKHLKYFLTTFLIAGIFISSPAQKKKKRKQQRIEMVIQKGKSYLGTPYKWGGNTRAGIDCSGLIYQSYKTIDIHLPRTAKAQSKIGNKRGWKGLRRGDLVYFKFKKKRKKWYHSGIITRVERNRILFIHASSSKGVVESNLLSNYYKKRVKNFRRVIK